VEEKVPRWEPGWEPSVEAPKAQVRVSRMKCRWLNAVCEVVDIKY
jgi:hypothetical protein